MTSIEWIIIGALWTVVLGLLGAVYALHRGELERLRGEIGQTRREAATALDAARTQIQAQALDLARHGENRVHVDAAIRSLREEFREGLHALGAKIDGLVQRLSSNSD